MRCRVGGESVTGGGAEPFFSSLQTGGVSFSFALRCFLNGGATSRSLFEAGPCALIRGCAAAEARKERETESKATGRKTSVAMVRDGVFFLSSFFFQPRPSLGVVVSPSKTSLALGLSSRTYLASQAVLDREGKPRRGGRGEKREKREKNEPSLPSFLLSLPPSLSHPHPLPTLKKKKSSASSSSCRARARSASASGTSPRRPASARA